MTALTNDSGAAATLTVAGGSLHRPNERGLPPALEMQGISKAFDGKPALVDAGFSLAWGEVHALVGENGAGKSTLMNVATASMPPIPAARTSTARRSRCAVRRMRLPPGSAWSISISVW